MSTSNAYANELLADPERCKAQLRHSQLTYWKFADAFAVGAANGSNFPSWEATLSSSNQNQLAEEQGDASPNASPREDLGGLCAFGSTHLPQPSEQGYDAVVELSFRGSLAKIDNWVTNFKANLVPFKLGSCRGQVHQGFQSAYLLLRAEVFARIDGDLTDLKRPAQRVLVLLSGHSLGGVLAMLAAYDLATSRGYETRCVTFGSPRVGDAEFVRTYVAAVPRTARFINKFDPVPRLPSNSLDPHDDGPVIIDLLRGVLTKTQQAFGVAEYCHVCEGTVLDADASRVAHLLAGGFEAVASIQNASPDAVAAHFFSPHILTPAYQNNLEQLLGSVGAQRQKFHLLPSVGTWLEPIQHEPSLLALIPSSGGAKEAQRWWGFAATDVLSSIGMDWQMLLKYAPALIRGLREHGFGLLANVLLTYRNVSMRSGSLEAAGVEVDMDGNARLEDVLERQQELLETEEGAAMLKEAQERFISMLPMLVTAAVSAASSDKSSQFLRQLEQTELGCQFVQWGREQLASAETQPDLMKTWFHSFEVSLLAEWSSGLQSHAAAACKKVVRRATTQCLDFLRSDLAKQQLRAAGVDVDEDGNVSLEQVLEKGQKLLETEEGARFLGRTQEQALALLSTLEAQSSHAVLSDRSQQYIKQLQDSERGRAFLAWGQRHLEAAKGDPESLKQLLVSLNASQVASSLENCGELSCMILNRLADNDARSAVIDHIKGKCLDFLCSDDAKQQLRDVGVEVDDKGNVRLEQVLEKGQALLETSQGTELLRNVQAYALQLLQAGNTQLPEQAKMCLSHLKRSETGRKLLSLGTQTLATAEQDPEALKKVLKSFNHEHTKSLTHWGKKVICTMDAVSNDSDVRAEFLTTVTDYCLEFLMEQLSLLEVPAITGVYEGVEFSVDNIDLSSCRVRPEDVKASLRQPNALKPSNVQNIERNLIVTEKSKTFGNSGLASQDHIQKTIHSFYERESNALSATVDSCHAYPETSNDGMEDSEVLHVVADNISVDMTQLQWSFRQMYFPYMNGGGSAKARIRGGSIVIALRLERVSVDGEERIRLGLTSCRVAIKELILTVNESVFSWAYNMGTTWLQEYVRDFVCACLEEALTANIASLLSPLNKYTCLYLPLLLSTTGVTLPKTIDREEYTVKLKPIEGKKLGIAISKLSLTIVAISKDGALGSWNDGLPQYPIQIGDTIVEVNGICSSMYHMLKELQKGKVSEIVLARSGESLEAAKTSNKGKAEGNHLLEVWTDMECPNGHDLQDASVRKSSAWFCDVCATNFRFGSSVCQRYRCTICNYDECQFCFAKRSAA